MVRSARVLPGEPAPVLGGLAGADEPASALAPEFARPGVMVVELEQFAPICDPMLRDKAVRP